MSKIFICGDVHGGEDYGLRKLTSSKFPEGKELTKDDYVIIAGDFGCIWDVNESKKQEAYNLKWLASKPWTTLFIDGNHENFDRLNSLPTKQMFNGTVGVVNDSIYHLKRGEVYTINGKTFFTFGGATSVDKNQRREFISWWKEEIPNIKEIQHGLVNLAKVENKVDYVITHTCPGKIFYYSLPGFSEKNADPTYKILNMFYDLIDYKHWYFGHFHIDKNIDKKFTILYNKVREIK